MVMRSEGFKAEDGVSVLGSSSSDTGADQAHTVRHSQTSQVPYPPRDGLHPDHPGLPTPPEISSSWSSGGGWPRCSQLGGLYFFRVTYCRPIVFLAFFTRFLDRVLGGGRAQPEIR